MKLLTQNSELKPHGIWNFSIPAWFTRLDDGTVFKTCPNAGGCAKVCYARNGSYLFSNVQAAHRRNLQFILDKPFEWQSAMIAELSQKRFRPQRNRRPIPDGVDVGQLDPWLRKWIHDGGKAVRIHDAGDFFARWYLDLWFEIAERVRDVLFYAYTKEVAMFAQVDYFPRNFRYLFSTGGLQDHLITQVDRHAEVFPTAEALAAAGYRNQEANDLLAVLLPTTRIGIVANNIPHFNKKIAGRRFSEL
jgi:hypothetical protein